MRKVGGRKALMTIIPDESQKNSVRTVSGSVSRSSGGRVFVAMSGGVDSSVAALLLKQRGYEVVGVFMRCYNIDGCAERDAEDARRVAEKIGVPFYVWDFEAEYKKKVVDYMINGYRRGETPNPDVMCNREIKFGLFLERALRLGADYVATGHYVRRFSATPRQLPARPGVETGPGGELKIAVNREPAVWSLFEAKDKNKDQSYFLWTLTQKQLRHCLFPIGDYLKSEVREIARRAGLPTAGKKDSQGICFLGKVTLEDFLKQYIPEKRGAVLSLSGEKLGEHRGAHFYTIGQRQGIGGIKHQQGVRLHAPLYVAAKDIRENTIVVAAGADNPALYRREVELAEMNIINPQHRTMLKRIGLAVMARVRYRQPLAAAVVRGNKLVFDTPQKFVAPGQSAVFYSGEGELLGGGVIQ